MERGRLLLLALACVCVLVALHLSGGLVNGPAGWSLEQLRAWLDHPVPAAAAILRALSIALSYYLLAVTGLLLIFGERVQDGPLGRFLPLSVLAMIGMATTASVAGMHETTPQLDLKQTPNALTLTEAASPLVLTPVTEAPAQDPWSPDSPHGTRHVPTPDVSSAQTAVETWTVEPGESFWSIAEEHLADTWQLDELSDEQIVRYWKPLIAANEDRLVDPGNPDLLLPGQELVLPATPEAP